ncbi:hypothetical protein, partial [Deinococcus pimensis]|uniref:hypothetical protein n=1 Tax=Deinococcus pimensis TaxID=309888 RepID=UPI0005EB6161
MTTTLRLELEADVSDADRALAEAYWALNDEHFVFKVAELARRFDVSPTALPACVKAVASVVAVNVTCAVCGSHPRYRLRSEFNRALMWPAERQLCVPCLEAGRRRRAERDAREREWRLEDQRVWEDARRARLR